jgi:rubrerythrin
VPPSRRDLLRFAGLGAAGGSLAFLAACGGGGAGPGASARETDRRLLNSTLDLEHAVIAAYSEGLALLRGSALQLGRRLRDQERAHAERLRRVIQGLGGTPTPPKSREEYHRSFPKLESQADVLRFATDLENLAVAAYVDATPKLSTGELRRTTVAIAANEAEHISVLLGARGMPSVPDALVTGRQ